LNLELLNDLNQAQRLRNAVRYLANNIVQGIITPLTYPYHDAILRRAGAVDLAEAEEVILRSGQNLPAKEN